MEISQLRQKMQDTLEAVGQEIGSLRTGRATPALVQDIIVPAYGGTQHLRVLELATITAPDTQTLSIAPWDKSIIGDIKKGIDLANVGLTPIITGEEIRINLPPMTQEDREKYIKLLSQYIEKGKVAARQIRQDAMKDVEEAFETKALSEDQKVAEEKLVQEITDQFVAKIDEAGKAKESELRSL